MKCRRTTSSTRTKLPSTIADCQATSGLNSDICITRRTCLGLRRSRLWLRSILVAGTFATGLTPALNGQVNIESLRPERTDSGLTGTVGANLVVRTGNVELLELGINGRVEYLRSNSRTLLLWDGELGFLSGDRFSNDGLLHLRHGRTLDSPATLEGFAQVNYDKSRLLDFRTLIGAGVRLDIVETRRLGLRLGAGYMFEHESLSLAANAVHPAGTYVHRATSYLVARFTDESRFALASTSYAQPDLDDPRDVRVLSTLGIAVTVTRTISLAVKFDLRYDSRPPDNTAKLDTELRNGVTVSL